jgi:hypothetical protein
MSGAFGGGLWLLIDVGFVAFLGLAMAYGIVRARRMSGRKKEQRDQATRDLYDQSR